MQAVADDLRPDIFVLHGGRDDTGVAVVDAGHGVVQVGQVGDAGVNGGLGVVVVGIGVGDGHGAKLLGLFHEFGSTGQLRGDVHNPHQPITALVQCLEALEVRLLQVVGILCAPLFVGEVGAFHLNAHDPGAAFGGFLLQFLAGGEGLCQHLIGQGHGGRGEGGNAAAGVEPGHGLQTLVIAVGKVGAGVAVAVDFDEAGDDGGTLQVDGIGRNLAGQNRAEQAVLHLKGTGMEPEIGTENAGVFIEHRAYSFIINYGIFIIPRPGRKSNNAYRFVSNADQGLYLAS